jgi:hypothetical protein
MSEAMVVLLGSFLGSWAANITLAIVMVAAPRLFAKWLAPTAKAYEEDQRREED